MKVKYIRVSSISQNTCRQELNNEFFPVVDKCSGSIPFFERDGGKGIMEMIEEQKLTELYVSSIDRLGRDLRDILNVITIFNEKKIPIHFQSQGLTTLNSDGKENQISKMIISIMAIFAEMERNLIKERQKEGIQIAKMKGIYTGRKRGTTEDVITFLNKDKNQKVIKYLKKGYKSVEISKIVGIHINTITKIKKHSRIIK
jgi:DNA invertase Pin-like site-specific DNA recombinase